MDNSKSGKEQSLLRDKDDAEKSLLKSPQTFLSESSKTSSSSDTGDSKNKSKVSQKKRKK